MRSSLGLIETRMCSRSWQDISIMKLTHGACSKYWRALSSQTPSHTYNHTSSDRISCASRLTRHLETVVDRYDRFNERIDNLPFVFPASVGKYVSYGLQCIHEKGNTSIMSTISEDIYRLDCKWRRIRIGSENIPPIFIFQSFASPIPFGRRKHVIRSGVRFYYMKVREANSRAYIMTDTIRNGLSWIETNRFYPI